MAPTPAPTADAFAAHLDELRAQHAPDGVPMRAIFALAKELSLIHISEPTRPY